MFESYVYKYYVFMNKNGKMRHVETIPGRREGRDKKA
jgi:hypothetical protein